MPDKRSICSWDSIPHPCYNTFTTGNVNEVLPGLTRPLPADLIRAWDYYWCSALADDMKVQDLVLVEPPPVATVLPFVAGRWTICFAFTNAFAATYQVGQGSDFLKQFFDGGERLMSGAAADLGRAEATRRIIVQRWHEADERFARNTLLSKKAHADTLARRHDQLPDADLIRVIDENTILCGEMFVAHFYNSVGGAEFTTLLGNLIDAHIKEHPADWVSSLTSGLTEVESARPAKAIWDLSRLMLRHQAVATDVGRLLPEEFLERLSRPISPAWAEVAREYEAFIAEFGYRGQREVDPSSRTWNESPNFAISSLRADMAAPPERSPYILERTAAESRQRLEAEIEARLPESAREEYRQILRLAQMLSRGREGSKANWARACRNYRPPITEMARRLVQRGIIAEPEDVWFLRLLELREAAQGKLSADAARAGIAARKTEYAEMAKYDLPEIFELPVYPIARGAPSTVRNRTYKGIGISPGVATGKARVILSADAATNAQLQPGEILIAPFTDAPWTPLFIPAAGVITETGGLLSHAAVVAREYGLPAVAGIKDATTSIPSGATVTIDGSTGTVTVVPG